MHSTLTRLYSFSTLSMLIIFVLVDGLSLGLHWLYTEEILKSRFFNASRDRGFAEIISYFKYILIILVFANRYKFSQKKIWQAWLIFFLVILFDDSLGLHEFIGKLIVNNIDINAPSGMRAKDLAELFGFMLLEGVAAAWVGLCFCRASKKAQLFSIGLAIVLIPLIFSGVVLDNLHYPLIEQLGEMFGATLVFLYVWYLRDLGNGNLPR